MAESTGSRPSKLKTEGTMVMGDQHDPAKQPQQISPKRDPIVIPVRFYVPRKVCQKSFETIDSQDSPDRPGLIKEASLRSMSDRFFGTFGADKHRDEFEHLIEHLRRHTRRRRGDSVLEEGFVEWENTSRVYEMFKVDLNIFERIFFTVDVSESSSIFSKFCSIFLIAAILCSIVNWMVSTLPEMTEIPPCEEKAPANSTGGDYWCCQAAGDCTPEAKTFFKMVEYITVLIFTFEYLIRLLTVHSVRFELLNEFFLEWTLTGNEDKKGKKNKGADGARSLDSPFMTTIKHILATSNLIDLLSILPFWIERFADDGSGASVLVILRILRLTRIFRVFKLGKYNDVFAMFSSVIQQSLPALGLMLFFIAMGLCLFGTLIWFAEQGTWYPKHHPKLIDMGITNRGAWLRGISSIDADLMDETPFPSIVHSFWYVIVTITTVGYGDAFPTTDVGKLVGTLTILCGIVVLAMPVGVIGSNFSNEYAQRETEKKRRAKLKQQQEQQAKVEMEQDTAADLEAEGKAPDKEAAVTQASQGNELRQKILIDAEEMDNMWKELFPDHVHEWISRCLRQFVSEFIDGAMNTGKANPKGVRQTNLPHRLDQLTIRFNEACSSQVSYDELAEFGIKEAHKMRRRFSGFCDKIWEYWAIVGPPEKPSDPFEYFELKALLTMNLNAFASPKDSKPMFDREAKPMNFTELQQKGDSGPAQMNHAALRLVEAVPSAPKVPEVKGCNTPPLPDCEREPELATKPAQAPSPEVSEPHAPETVPVSLPGMPTSPRTAPESGEPNGTQPES